jgi:hypothetical protein
VGGRVAFTWLNDAFAFHLGASGMAGTYDPENQLWFYLLGLESFFRVGKVYLRGEVLERRTEMALGDNPEQRFHYGPGLDGKFDPWFLKQGFYGELEFPVGPVDLVLRADGLRRKGNVAATSLLRSDSEIFRYTLATSLKLTSTLRLKVSGEFYDFSDFDDEIAAHVGIAGPF